jgi:hypothetical protein
VPALAALHARLEDLLVEFLEDGDQTYLDPLQTLGRRVVLTPARLRPRVGPCRFLYEVTNSITSGWQAAADRYAVRFGLDPERFVPIQSRRFGYTGTLALFDPLRRLDRIEIAQVVDPGTAMWRWVSKRGDSLYMCYAEADDVPAIVRRLMARGARFTSRGADPAAERDGVWIHPSALHGLLLGVSRATLAWEWSGRPGRVAPLSR